jgi:hypothetical protein
MIRWRPGAGAADTSTPSCAKTSWIWKKVRALRSVEVLVELLLERVSSSLSMSSLARDLRVSAHTVKHWLEILENLYVIFAMRPHHQNVARSLLKESKCYF